MSEPLTVAIEVDDPALAERLTELLAQLPDLRIAGPGEMADLVMASAESLDSGSALTPREREVVALLAEGLSNKEIALRLGIAPDTAKFHVGRIIDKLDATGRTGAVAHAARLGVIHL